MGEHDLARPLLLFYTPHVVHMPLQVPQPGHYMIQPLVELYEGCMVVLKVS